MLINTHDFGTVGINEGGSRCGSCDSNAMFLLGNLSIKSSCLDDISASFVGEKVSRKHSCQYNLSIHRTEA